jgi:ribonuclease-3
MRPVDVLVARLGLNVRDVALYEQALTHDSYLHEHRDSVTGHNERLEFLGDAVIALVVSDALFHRRAGDDEGVLSPRRAMIVSESGLAAIARRLGLGELVRVGEGESRRDARTRASMLASALEAVVGAIFLDLGFDAARDWLLRVAAPELTADSPVSTLKSGKSQLQELTQRTNRGRPIYRIAQTTGPDHEKYFQVEVSVAGSVVAVGGGRSQKAAENVAADAALVALGTQPTIVDELRADDRGDDEPPSGGARSNRSGRA